MPPAAPRTVTLEFCTAEVSNGLGLATARTRAQGRHRRSIFELAYLPGGDGESPALGGAEDLTSSEHGDGRGRGRKRWREVWVDGRRMTGVRKFCWHGKLASTTAWRQIPGPHAQLSDARPLGYIFLPSPREAPETPRPNSLALATSESRCVHARRVCGAASRLRHLDLRTQGTRRITSSSVPNSVSVTQS